MLYLLTSVRLLKNSQYYFIIAWSTNRFINPIINLSSGLKTPNLSSVSFD